MWFSLGLMIVSAAFGGALYLGRRSSAGATVSRLLAAGGLPKDEKLMAVARERFTQQDAAGAIGLAGGGVAAAGILPLVTAVESKLLLPWTVMAMLAGAGIGVYGQRLRAVRATRPDGSRAATLRPRRLDDYLTRLEVVGQYVMLALPLLVIALGVLVLTTADESAARGWAMVVPALAAMPFAALGIYLQRRILALNQPASSVDELRWQEALRAKGLRDMAKILVGVGWVFGASPLLIFEWPAGVPAFAEAIGLVVFWVGGAGQVVMWGLADTRGALRRSQAAVQS